MESAKNTTPIDAALQAYPFAELQQAAAALQAATEALAQVAGESAEVDAMAEQVTGATSHLHMAAGILVQSVFQVNLTESFSAAEGAADTRAEKPAVCPYPVASEPPRSLWPPRHPNSAYEPSPEAIEHQKVLITIFNPLGKLAADKLAAAFNDQEAVAKTANEPTVLFSYGSQHLFGLPPDLFGDGQPQRAFSRTNSDYTPIYDYFDRTNPEVSVTSRQYYEQSGRHDNRIEDIAVALRQFSAAGGVPPESWDEYRTACVNFARYGNDGVAEFAKLKSIFNGNARGRNNYPRATFNFHRFVVGIADTGGDRFGIGDYVVTPVGYYGVGLAERLNAVGRLGAATIYRDSDVQAASDRAWEKHETELSRTARGAEGHHPVHTIQESWISNMQAAVNLTSQYVGGYETGEALMADIIKEGLIPRYTRLLPLGINGPQIFGGVFYPNPLYKNDEGRLDLRPEFEATLIDEYNKYMEEKGRFMHPDIFNHIGTGIMCPVAGKGGALYPLSAVAAQGERAFASHM